MISSGGGSSAQWIHRYLDTYTWDGWDFNRQPARSRKNKYRSPIIRIERTIKLWPGKQKQQRPTITCSTRLENSCTRHLLHQNHILSCCCSLAQRRGCLGTQLIIIINPYKRYLASRGIIRITLTGYGRHLWKVLHSWSLKFLAFPLSLNLRRYFFVFLHHHLPPLSGAPFIVTHGRKEHLYQITVDHDLTTTMVVRGVDFRACNRFPVPGLRYSSWFEFFKWKLHLASSLF